MVLKRLPPFCHLNSSKTENLSDHKRLKHLFIPLNLGPFYFGDGQARIYKLGPSQTISSVKEPERQKVVLASLKERCNMLASIKDKNFVLFPFSLSSNQFY